MKMTWTKKMMLFLVLLLIVFVSLSFYNTTPNHSVTTAGYVTKKSMEGYITINKFDHTKEVEKVDIIIRDENVWNLIENERVYFISYRWKDGETPYLEQIDVIEDFDDADLLKLKSEM